NWIVSGHIGTTFCQHLDDRHSRRLAYIIGIFLERKSQHGYGQTLKRIEMSAKEHQHSRRLVQIRLDHSIKNRNCLAMSCTMCRQRFSILRQAAPPISASWPEKGTDGSRSPTAIFAQDVEIP